MYKKTHKMTQKTCKKWVFGKYFVKNLLVKTYGWYIPLHFKKFVFEPEKQQLIRVKSYFTYKKRYWEIVGYLTF
jgi:hypothetical protein